MDGLLVIDKPAGPTSHDVVACVRRLIGQRRVGHTGTLDPMATGVLPLVIGRATRLARFLSASDKTYEATIRLGYATATGDAEGPIVVPSYAGAMPAPDVIDRALDGFRGRFLQRPPVFSAKKIGGTRSHRLARLRLRGDRDPPDLPPVSLRPQPVTVSRLVITRLEGDLLSLEVECSAGFYIRALAHDLGERLGTGGHLAALRRTNAGDLTLKHAVPLEVAERDGEALVARIVPLAQMLTHLPALTLDAASVTHTVQGRDLERPAPLLEAHYVRLLDEGGDLVAIAEPSREAPGLLHPSVVLR